MFIKNNNFSLIDLKRNVFLLVLCVSPKIHSQIKVKMFVNLCANVSSQLHLKAEINYHQALSKSLYLGLGVLQISDSFSPSA